MLTGSTAFIAENQLLRHELDKCRDDYQDNYHCALARYDKKEARYCEERIKEIDKLLKQNEYTNTMVNKGDKNG